MKKYITVLNNEKYNAIDIYTGYDKAKKEYYITFAAVKLEGVFVKFELFSAPYKRYPLLTVNRQSKKAQAQAEQIAQDDFEIYLNHFTKHNNLTIA
jgi:hypothetical protein